jgi:hypothetical protein
VLVAQQIGVVVVGAAAVAKPPSCSQVTSSGTTLAPLAKADVLFALLVAEVKLTKTIEAKIPIMAITTSNSINVKPFFSILF